MDQIGAGFLSDRIPVVIEFPAEWVASAIPSEARQSARYFSEMLSAAMRLGLRAETAPSAVYSDAAPRLYPSSQCVISYHTFGDEPNVWRVKEGYLPGFFTFDRLGYSGFSELARFPDRFRAEIDAFDLAVADAAIARYKARFFDASLSKYTQPETISAPLPETYVFFPLQTVHDRVQRFARVLQTDAIIALAQASAEAQVPLIIKRHPYCHDETTTRVLQEVDAAFPLTQVVDGPIRDLIRGAAAIVGANSGALFEALLAGKPVFSFADSDFAQATRLLRGISDFGKVFENSAPEQTIFQRSFLGWYLERYCMQLDRAESFVEKLQVATQPVATWRAGSRWWQLRADIAQNRIFSAEWQSARQQVKQAYADVEFQRRLGNGEHLGLVELNLVRDAYNIVAANHLAEWQAWSQTADGHAHPLALAKWIVRQKDRPASALVLDESARERFCAQESEFARNNGLRDVVPLLARTNARTILAIGCQDPVFFERAAPCFETLIAFATDVPTPLPDLGNIRRIPGDLVKDALPDADLCCSFDVLQDLPDDDLDTVIDRLTAGGAQQFHVISCYDRAYAGKQVLDPGAWLALFQSHRPEAWIYQIQARFNDSLRVVCNITTLPHTLLP
jgi:hypothetical protein